MQRGSKTTNFCFLENERNLLKTLTIVYSDRNPSIIPAYLARIFFRQSIIKHPRDTGMNFVTIDGLKKFWNPLVRSI